MAPKRIWLTGARGFVGRRLASVLTRTGSELHCFTNANAGSSGKVLGVIASRTMDYRNAEDIEANVRRLGLPDVFVHLGWGDMDKPDSAVHLEGNLEEGKVLISTLFQQGLKTFLFIGSGTEYGGRVGRLSEEMEAQGQLTNYAKGKIEVARFGFQSARAHQKTFIHARTFYVYGAGQREGSLINDLYQSYCSGSDVSLSPCEHYRDYIHVFDVAEGLRRMTDVKESTTVNLGSGATVQVKDFVLRFWKTLGGDEAKLKFGARPMRSSDPEQPRSFADLVRLKDLIHWQPLLSLEEGIQLTVRELRAES